MSTDKNHSLSPVIVGIILIVLFIGIIAAINFFSNSYIQRIVIGLCISIILVVSLNLSSGLTGIFSLGQIGFMALGAYTSAILTLPLSLKPINLPDLPSWLANTELSFLPATLIAGILAMLIALIVGYSLMRLTGPYVSVATLGFMVIVYVVLLNWDSMTRGARTFSGVPPHTTIWWVAGWAILTVYVVWRITRSAFGRQLMASRDNEIASKSIGVNVLNGRLLAFCISAFFTAIAGSLWAHFIQSFSPKAFFFTQTFSIITMLIAGGIGSTSGSILGAVGITILSEIFRNAERGFDLGLFQVPPIYGASQIIMAVIFILLIVFRPDGIMGKRELDFGHIINVITGRVKRKEVLKK